MRLNPFSSRANRLTSRRLPRAPWAACLALGVLAASAAFAAPLPDRDGDGIADRKDLCPATPRGAAPIAEGCSALEVVLAPELFVELVRSLLDEERGRSFSEAAEALGAGDVCHAADLFDAAVAELEAGELLAVAKGRAAAGAARAACGQVVSSGRLRGPVADVDDASRTFRFADDQVVGIAAKSLPAGLMADRRIDGRGLRFADGTALLTSLRGDLPAEAPMTKADPCLKVMVAPFQHFPPVKDDGLPYRLRETTGYLKDGVVNLELTQRLAAESTGCPTGTFGQFYRYTMQINVTQGANTWTIATDLRHEEAPVPLPNLVSGQVATVSATTFKTVCNLFCGPPQKQGAETFQLVARPYGAYVTIAYNKTVFNVGGNEVINDFEPAQITTVTLSPNLPSASPAPIFFAQGYKLNSNNNPSSSPTGVLVPDKFAVYELDDLFDETAPIRSEFALKGVAHVAGLNWPTLTGWNAVTGDAFEYSATLPKIVRDRVTDCSGALDTYYWLPFRGGYPAWNVTKGNFDDPTNGYPAGVRQFALAFSAPAGTDVYAARGGVVVALEEGESTNASEPSSSSSVGNWVSIRHEDGTYGFYFHLAQNGVQVEVGDRVYRDWHIGDVGGNKLVFEIGDQCPPHQCPSLSSGYQTVKGLYRFTDSEEVFPGVWVPGDTVDCKVPRAGEKIFF